MDLRYSTKQDIPGIKKLMKNVFGDNDQFLHLLFHHLYHDNILLYEENDEIISMAFLLPAFMNYGQSKIPMTYLYACATDEKYRGQGLMGNIIERAYQDEEKKQGGGLFLLPASESLYHYYEKYGFQCFFFNDKREYQFADFRRPSSLKYEMEQISGSEYAAYREQFLAQDLAIHYPVSHFLLLENDKERNFIFCTIKEEENIKGIAAFRKEHHTLEVSELLFPNPDENQLQALFFSRFDICRIHIAQPGTKNKTAMIRLTEQYKKPEGRIGYFCWSLE